MAQLASTISVAGFLLPPDYDRSCMAMPAIANTTPIQAL